MSNRDVLSRQLSEEGCIIVGAGLTAKLEELSKQGISLPQQVQDSAQEVLSITNQLRNQPTREENMQEVDRGADGTVGSLYELIKDGVALYNHNYINIIPLNTEQQERATLFRQTLDELFPAGTSFLKLRYSEQWVHFDKLQKKIESPENSARLQKLGLHMEASYAIQWINLYGVRLGITKVDPKLTDPRLALVQEWHEAWADFSVDVRSAFKTKNNPSAAKQRELLLGGYETRAEEERDKERRYKPKI